MLKLLLAQACEQAVKVYLVWGREAVPSLGSSSSSILRHTDERLKVFIVVKTCSIKMTAFFQRARPVVLIPLLSFFGAMTTDHVQPCAHAWRL